jgi:hypothetical protein
MTDPTITAEELDRLHAATTQGTWLEGGPYPGTSVCVCIDPGSGFPDPEPPYWEPVCVLDQRTEGEPSPQAEADMRFIIAAHKHVPSLAAEIRRLTAERDRLRVALEAIAEHTPDEDAEIPEHNNTDDAYREGAQHRHYQLGNIARNALKLADEAGSQS